MKKFHKYILFISFFFTLFAANSQDTIYQIDIDKEIGSTTWRYLRTGLHRAQQEGAKAIILRLNTYGGTVVHADSMRTAILNYPLPVYAFIDNNAASAGALIAIACDSIYMRSSASMGAATVVNETGAAMPDKYQSYMRATMRATAEAHGKDSTGNWRRNPLIAEAMVDERIVVPHLCDSGKVLTLTASEAMAQRYCEGVVENVDELVTQQLHRSHYTLRQFEPTLFDEFAGFLRDLHAELAFLVRGVIIQFQQFGDVCYGTALDYEREQGDEEHYVEYYVRTLHSGNNRICGENDGYCTPEADP